ncbi:hypothetical protein [Streptosporangium jomthongense]|uniref:DNA-binding protein n=1 Tax=Streptosporangium jomthongense TaxID=1193683 RepID=A0ABV8F8E0_9ACTN
MTGIRDLIAQTRLDPDVLIRATLTGLTWHVRKPLADAEITTLGRLAEETDDSLLALPGLGQRRLDALRAELERIAQEKGGPQ